MSHTPNLLKPLDYAQMTDDSLTIAYRAALYEVDLPGLRLELRVDVCSETLQRWLQSHGHHCAAVLTAHNPGSRQSTAAANREAQQQLQELIRQCHLNLYSGRNLDPRGQWPPEDSLLVPDLSMDDANALALRFGQRAFLWCDASGTPRLHETRPA